MNVTRPLLLLAWLLATPSIPQAQANCSELAGTTIRWIVPNRPGGGYDAYSRLLQPFLEQSLDARVLVENRPEAGGQVGAMAIRDADADGGTLGLINAAGLLAASLREGSDAPDPASDFSVLGRMTRNHVVMFTGRDSGFSTVDEMLEAASGRALVVGVRDAGSVSLMVVPMVADLLAVDYELVSGYVGSSARVLALMRGEVDIVFSHFDSVQGQVRAGELVPLLQLTAPPGGGANRDPAFAELPRLGGPGGLAVRRSSPAGLDPGRARQAAEDLDAVIGAGRLMVAPPALAPDLHTCLQARVEEIMHSAGFAEAARQARLGIDYADGETALAEVRAGRAALNRFRESIRAAIEQLRR